MHKLLRRSRREFVEHLFMMCRHHVAQCRWMVGVMTRFGKSCACILLVMRHGALQHRLVHWWGAWASADSQRWPKPAFQRNRKRPGLSSPRPAGRCLGALAQAHRVRGRVGAWLSCFARPPSRGRAASVVKERYCVERMVAIATHLRNSKRYAFL
jgi:hypothetical protein